MNIRKIKKEVKKLDDEIFKKEALKWLRKIKVWSNHDSINSKSNMRVLTKNFMRNKKFINNGIW